MDAYEPLEEQFGQRLTELARLFRTNLDRRLKPLGLSLSQWQVLRVLQRDGDGVAQRSIAERIGVEAASLVSVLDRLEKHGLVHRRADVADRRAKLIYLSEKALTVIPRAAATVSSQRRDYLTDVSREDILACLRVFDRMTAAAAREGESA